MRSRKRIAIFAFALVLTIVGSGYAVNAWYQEVLDIKTVRTGRGIIERKEHIIGSEEYRVYYRITDFGRYNDRKRGILEEAERRRIATGNLRSEDVGKAQYDYIQLGDKIQFNNQYLGDDDFMTWGVEKPRITILDPK